MSRHEDPPLIPTDVRTLTEPTLPITAELLRRDRRIFGEAEDEHLLDLAGDAAEYLIDNSRGYVYGSAARFEATARLDGVEEILLTRYPFDGSRSFTITVDGEAVDHKLSYGQTSLCLVTLTDAAGNPTRYSGDLVVTWPAGGSARKAKRYIQLAVGHWYENREATAPIQVRTVPMTCDDLARSLRPARGEFV